jgi:hypothetical protein
MRKLLLGTTALAAAATLSANAALADVSISGYMEWHYTSRSSNVTSNDGTSFLTDSEITMNFSNKTDSGLDISMKTEFATDDGNSIIDEASMSIAGGFGKVTLGGDDGATDGYGIGASDLLAQDSAPSVASASIGTSSDTANVASDGNKITYDLPAMGGLTVGVSFTDSGATGNTDTTAYGAKYTMEAAGNTITIGGVSASTGVAGAQDNDTQNMGVKIVNGALSMIVAQSEQENAADNIETTGAALSYDMGNGMVIGAHTQKSEDSLDTAEEYTSSGVELAYTIASGLTAYINVDDYEYTATTADGGSGGSTTTQSDSGTHSRLTIKATF